MDMGDHVIVVNADKVVLTSGKAQKKQVHHHSGYPGGLTSRSYADSMARRPADTVRKSITGMLPKNRLGRQMATKLKVYAGPDHPHGAQAPTALEIPGARREVN
jgi:large subunit ribosomal protein L13